MSVYDTVLAQLERTPRTWLITGVAGFIGSNLLEALLKLGQTVVGLDNFSTGFQHNLDEVRNGVSAEQWRAFRFINGDIRDLDVCRGAAKDVDHVLHQAALGSVPRSIADPVTTNSVNIDGFLNILVAAREQKVSSFTYAASSSTYGDHPALPKVESTIGNPLSPYAVTKLVNELYADVFSRCYGFDAIGLRYFNVFGPRQDSEGAYTAVIPKWTASLLRAEPIYINGDGETSRDFCFIANIIQANLLASVNTNPNARNQVYNIAVGDRTTLNDLFTTIRAGLVSTVEDEKLRMRIARSQPVYREFRSGDVRHSMADVTKAQRLLGYRATHSVQEGMPIALSWYLHKLSKNRP